MASGRQSGYVAGLVVVAQREARRPSEKPWPYGKVAWERLNLEEDGLGGYGGANSRNFVNENRYSRLSDFLPHLISTTIDPFHHHGDRRFLPLEFQFTEEIWFLGKGEFYGRASEYFSNCMHNCTCITGIRILLNNKFPA